MTWQDYEKTVRDIYETLGKDYGVKIIGYGPSFKRSGKSGVDHQIDVLTGHSDGIHPYLTAIECKYWNDKVNKDTIMKVNDIIKDCNIDKGVIVTKMGFTPDAIKFAKFTKVQLVELREHNFSRTDDEITKYYAHMEVRKPCLANAHLHFKKDVHPKVIDSGFNDGNMYDFYFEYPDKSIKQNKELVLEFLNKKVTLGIAMNLIEERIRFPKGTVVKKISNDLSFPIDSVSYIGYSEWFTCLDQYYFESNVWLLMKVLFEARDFVVDVNGKVKAFQRKPANLNMQPGSEAFIIVRFYSRNLSTGEIKSVKMK